MLTLREVEQRLLTENAIRGNEVKELQDLLYEDGEISRNEADFLVELYKRVRNRSPEFRQFFYNAIKDHVLSDGRINAEETAWLRQMIFHDDRVQDEERQFLTRLKGEATATCPEFEELFRECMKQPMEQRTSGRKE
ncbi:MAG TPA: hypothetical protein VFA18_24165 [Gemmataceae bacterium]|nr:hypothetical protein [Gemmataceae bacterium]